MKKLLFLTIALFLLAFAGHSQVVSTMSRSLDTISNTTAQNAYLQVASNPQKVAVQIVVTKRTGTIAGKAELQGTLDGTNYKRIATDTLFLTNQTTNHYIWVVTNPVYISYRVLITGSGTMSASFLGYLYKKD